MYKQGNARGTGEVRRRTSSIHFHCPVPRSSSHIGHGKVEIPKAGIPKSGIPKTEIPKAGIPKAGKTHSRTLPETEIPKPGIPKSGIPKTGIPKAGMPKLGIPKTGRFTAPLVQTPLRPPLIFTVATHTNRKLHSPSNIMSLSLSY